MAFKLMSKPIVLPKLKTLLESPNSCVSCVKNYKMHLVISASNLGRLKETVREVLNSKVTYYDSVLDGVVVGHKNVKILDSIPMDFDETRICYQADVYLFQIKVGSTLCGVVNKKSRDYVGVLVHCVFNAALYRPSWQEGCPKIWPGSHLSIGQEVSFEVTFINFCSRPPLIKGKLISTYQEEVDSGIGGQESVEDESHDEAMKKKIKKKKRLVDIGPDANIDDDLDTSSIINALSVFDEDKSYIGTIATTEATSLNEEDIPKKSKKRKRLSEGENQGNIADTSVTLIEEPPKKKKKKKSTDDNKSLIDHLIGKEMDSINILEDSAVNINDESRVHNEEERLFMTEEWKKNKKRKKKCENINESSMSLIDELVHDRRESLNTSSVLSKEEGVDSESSTPSTKHKTKRKKKCEDMNESSMSLINALIHERRDSLNKSSVLSKEEGVDSESSTPSTKHKTKRKKKCEDMNESSMSLINALIHERRDSLNKSSVLSKGEGVDSESSTPSTKHKTKRKKKCEDMNESSMSLINALIHERRDSLNKSSVLSKEEGVDSESSTPSTKHKTKRKKKCEDMNESSMSVINALIHERRDSLNTSSVLSKEEGVDSESSTPSTKHKTKRKNKHKVKEVSPEEIPDEDVSMSKSTDQLNVSTTKLKKKKKRKSSVQDLESSLLSEALAGLN